MSNATTSNNRREAARLRKRRERERRRQRALETARALAEQREIADEELAPAVLRNPIVSPTGEMILGPRVTIENGRPVRACGLPDRDVIRNLARSSPLIQRKHYAAARQLQMDHIEVGGGISPSAAPLLRVGGTSDRAGPSQAILRQIDARDRLEGALAACGAVSGVVVRVVLDAIPATVWAEQAHVDLPDAVAQLSVGLSRVAEFYWPAPDQPAGRIRAVEIGN